ncbi:MAG: hypothetical protein WBV26_23820 [Candidatus Sulfotelmatobacter sp.]
MSMESKLTGLLMAGVLCVPVVGQADTRQADTQTTHRVHSKKKALPPPLPSGSRGPVPQIPLDSIPAVAPEVTYENGLLTIVAPNSTLGDILRSVRKHTAADIDVPASASERVATRLGPAPAREVMAELLNGSRFNYILLGSPADANSLVRVVLVAKTPDTPNPETTPAANNAATAPQAANAADAAEADTADDNATDDSADQSAAEAEQATPSDQPGVKTPQQMLQEMQQRQLLMQQQQQANQPGVNPPPPAMPVPHQPQPPPDQR